MSPTLATAESILRWFVYWFSSKRDQKSVLNLSSVKDFTALPQPCTGLPGSRYTAAALSTRLYPADSGFVAEMKSHQLIRRVKSICLPRYLLNSFLIKNGLIIMGRKLPYQRTAVRTGVSVGSLK